MHSPRHKVIITGTGRSGTTLLVRLLTELGLDTGFRRETWQQHYFAHCQAGLESELEDPRAPYVIKNPELCIKLADILARTPLVIDHAIIPVRALEEAALSRVRVGGDGRTPGGLVEASDAATQQVELANRFHRLVETLTAHDIPHTFLSFPRFARDETYTFAKLQSLLGGVTREQFSAAFRRVAQPELIHSFAGGQTIDAGRPGRAFARLRWHKRIRRTVSRIATAAALIAVGWFLARGGSVSKPTPAVIAAAPKVAPAAAPKPSVTESKPAPHQMSFKQYVTVLQNLGAFSGPHLPAVYRPHLPIHPTSESKAAFEPLLEAEADEVEILHLVGIGPEPGFFVR